MSVTRWTRRVAATSFFSLMLVSALCGAATAAPSPSSPASIPPGQIPSIDPHVPRPAGQPCVVELLHDGFWPQADGAVGGDPTVSYTYTPPPACPPPWSKVILKVGINTQGDLVDTFGVDMDHVRLFRGASPHYRGDPVVLSTSSWQIERDLTDYSALFKMPQSGLIWSTQNVPSGFANPGLSSALTGSVKLLFYPATAATPAPEVPDAVIAVNQDSPVDLPHNIERAYLDVEGDYQGQEFDTSDNDHPFWYTCYSDSPGSSPFHSANTYIPLAPGGYSDTELFLPQQGCGGGGFREVKIRVDGTLAGIAPAFPLVVADLNWMIPNSADWPITTLEMLNFKPYRVDLTPFAAVLSATGPHNVTADNRNPSIYNSLVDGVPVLIPGILTIDNSRSGGTTLLLYLDPHSSQVTGAVTRNTLATEDGVPTEVNTIQQTGLTIQGGIKMRQRRDFDIRGFVNTSHGRIDSCVHQISDFTNTQAFYLHGTPLGIGVTDIEPDSENIWLTSTVQQISSRRIGHWLISWDRTSTQYPLQMTYSILGAEVFTGDGGSYGYALRSKVAVTQRRMVDSDHYRPGLGHFTAHAESGFQSIRTRGSEEANPIWESSTTRDYKDNFGSCYRADMTSSKGTITDVTKGQGCLGNRNWVIWFARPDGSPGTFDR